MAPLARIRAPIRGGILAIEDRDATGDDVVDDDEPGNGVVSGRSQIMVNVTHGQEGSTDVTVAASPFRSSGVKVFDGTVHTSSGVLWIGDATAEHGIWLPVPLGYLPVEVYAEEATQIPTSGSPSCSSFWTGASGQTVRPTVRRQVRCGLPGRAGGRPVKQISRP